MTWRPGASSPRPPAARRYGWFRLYIGFADHPKWRRIAADAQVPVTVVIATAAKLLEVANAGRPRGSVADFSPEEWAVSAAVDRVVVDRIWKALGAVGWIDREYLTTWDERQPDKEDPTRGERQARLRARRRAEREGISPPASNGVVGVTATAATAGPLSAEDLSASGNTVVGVTATPRPDRDLASEEASGLLWRPTPDGSSWLFGRGGDGDGLQMLVQLAGIKASVAPYVIRRWLGAIKDDAEELARIVHAIAEAGASGEDFCRRVDAGIATALERASGQASLRLPVVHQGGRSS